MTGLGSDAFLLACAGCRVTMLERNEIVFSLLRDGLLRGSKGLPETRAAVAEMMLLKGDFVEKKDELGNFDVLYIDPMFPIKRNTARSKKPMYLLQQLLGEAQEETNLLSLALSKARDRVVVKRAKRSPNYNNRKPDINFKGTSSRYDVYLVR
jgi:16S rRNA (guanine1516-N2)-methyltransferase